MKSNNIYTVLYSAVLGTVCALLLTAVAGFTASYVQANKEAQMRRNILDVLEISYSKKVSSKELAEIFDANIKKEKLGDIEVYRYIPPVDSNAVETVAVRFEGKGVWGAIKGFLSLEADMRTIRGITFYEQEETPGLGGEIASSWFCEQFKGKKIVDESGNVGVIMKKRDGEGGINKVDAITGATMTSSKVEVMLNKLAEKIVKEYGNNDQ